MPVSVFVNIVLGLFDLSWFKQFKSTRLADESNINADCLMASHQITRVFYCWLWDKTSKSKTLIEQPIYKESL